MRGQKGSRACWSQNHRIMLPRCVTSTTAIQFFHNPFQRRESCSFPCKKNSLTQQNRETTASAITTLSLPVSCCTCPGATVPSVRRAANALPVAFVTELLSMPGPEMKFAARNKQEKCQGITESNDNSIWLSPNYWMRLKNLRL